MTSWTSYLIHDKHPQLSFTMYLRELKELSVSGSHEIHFEVREPNVRQVTKQNTIRSWFFVAGDETECTDTLHIAPELAIWKHLLTSRTAAVTATTPHLMICSCCMWDSRKQIWKKSHLTSNTEQHNSSKFWFPQAHTDLLQRQQCEHFMECFPLYRQKQLICISTWVEAVILLLYPLTYTHLRTQIVL
jgi:hypothetical protein